MGHIAAVYAPDMGKSQTAEAVGVNEDPLLDPELKLFRHRKADSESGDSERKEEADQHWESYGGNPMDKATKGAIELRDRTPAVNINLSQPTIEAVRGDQMVERREVIVKPVDLSKGDDVIADMMTKVIRYFWVRANGHRAESYATLEQLINGLGWYHLYVNMATVPVSLAVDWVPDAHVERDTKSLKPNLTDARYVMRRTAYDLADAKAKWPQHAAVLELKAGAGNQPYPEKEVVERDVVIKHRRPGSRLRKEVTVWEYQFRRADPHIAYVIPETVDEAGEAVPERMEHLPEKEFRRAFQYETEITYWDNKTLAESTTPIGKYAKILEANPERYKEVSRKEANLPEQWYPYGKPVYYTSYVLEGGDGRDMWIERPRATGLSAFNYVAINGYWRWKDNNMRLFGMMSILHPTQLLLAKVLTQSVQMLATAIKGGGIANLDLFDKPDLFEKHAGAPGMWFGASRPIQEGDIHEFGSPAFPHFHAQLLDRLFEAFQQQTAVSEYLKGTETRERSEVLVGNLQARAQTTLAALYDPPESARIVAGGIIMEIIQNVIPPHAIMRILGEDADVEGVTYEMQDNPEDPQGEPIRVEIATAAEILKQASMSDYDLQVDTGEASTHAKGAIMNMMGQVMSSISDFPPEMQEIVYAIFLRSLPLPKGQAGDAADTYLRDREQAKLAQTADGIIETLPTLGPEDLQAVVEEGTAFLEQMAPPPPPEQMPPQPTA